MFHIRIDAFFSAT